MNCVRCDTDMVPAWVFRAMGPEEQALTTYHQARGLCAACYNAVRRNGTLIDYERVTMSTEELLDEVTYLIEDGMHTHAQIAQRLDTTRDAVSLGVRRAARRGDPRALAAREVLTR